jgi:dynein heavy chain
MNAGCSLKNYVCQPFQLYNTLGWLQIVNSACEIKNVVATCIGSDLLKSLLPHLMEQLELCQKSLSAYLEAKRAEFPRFYFVSDPTLLEILSLGSDPPSIVPHFQSGLFDSLTNVTFDKVASHSSEV